MVWGQPGGAPSAWADAVDGEEAPVPAAPLAPTAFKAGAAKVKEDDFPDLAVAAKVKESKKDKKKKEAKQKMSLTDFMKAGPGAGSSGIGARRTGGDIDLMSLPTAPRPRVEGEEPAARGMGGAFREYGGGGRSGRYGDDDRPRRDEDGEDAGPSRADMSDSWGADRKFSASGPDDRGRGGFGGGFRDRDGGRDGDRGFGGGGFRDRSRDAGFPDGPSRADEVDDWGKTKSFVPTSSSSRSRERGGGFGSGGFRDRSPPAFREPSRADTEDRWSKASGADFKPTAFEDRPRREYDDGPSRRGGFGFGDRDGSRERPWERERPPRDGSRDDRPSGARDPSAERNWRRADTPPAEGGAAGAGARERPRLNLAPRSGAPPAAPSAGAAAGAPKSSVFGAARPREEVLREQGRDAVKEDLRLEHEAVSRPETAEEKALRQEISDLQLRVEAGEADAEYESAAGQAEEAAEGEGEGEEAAPASKTVGKALEDLEARLQALQLELDSKAKYSRAGGGAEREGRASSKERPARQQSPGGWRRSGSVDANGGGAAAAPRGFRDDRPDRERRGGGDREGREGRPERNGGEGRDSAERDSRPDRDARGGGEREGREGRSGFGSRGYEEPRGGERGERKRDNFPPSDASREDKPRW